jgi:formylglycine-generating enzyme required for sulfatase activity
LGDLTIKGSYTGSASPYSTFDQGGNVFEWNEAIVSGSFRSVRGGSFNFGAISLAASTQSITIPALESNGVGFRVASIPEPGTGLLVMTGLLGLAWRRKRST